MCPLFGKCHGPRFRPLVPREDVGAGGQSLRCPSPHGRMLQNTRHTREDGKIVAKT